MSDYGGMSEQRRQLIQQAESLKNYQNELHATVNRLVMQEELDLPPDSRGFFEYLKDNFGPNVMKFDGDTLYDAMLHFEDGGKMSESLLPLRFQGNMRARIDYEDVQAPSNFESAAELVEKAGVNPWDGVPDFKQLASDFRPIATYDENGNATILQGNQVSLYRREWKDDKGEQIYETLRNYAEPDSEAEKHLLERKRDIGFSLMHGPDIRAGATPDTSLYFPSISEDGTPNFPDESGMRRINFTRTYASGKVSEQERFMAKVDDKWKIVPRSFLKSLSPSDDQLNRLGEFVREMLVRKYEASAIGRGGGDQSGTLLQAVRQAIVTHNVTPEASSVTVTLADSVRPARPGEKSGDDDMRHTNRYGALVFYGRTAIVHSGSTWALVGNVRTFSGAPYMRYRMHGEWITTKSVRPSRTDLDIMEFTAEEQDEIMAQLRKLVSENFKADKEEA